MAAAVPDPAAEDALIPLSALQHYLFCPRQCALIHVEQIWADDARTIEGHLLHTRVDAGGMERRPGVRIERGVALRSFTLGVAGRADVVEFHGTPPRPFPVEYKRGKPKPHRADEVQLCAQAICLEEMCGCPVPQGALFYGETRRRTDVVFDATLRALTQDIASRARAMMAAGITPAPVLSPGCRYCSLHDQCCPERLQQPDKVAGWLRRQLAG
ncbi:MAG: CRISPR-associated protein Cas4 [Proteobacteria bacterium]|nr:CRISPR-associated protein Cas4 [Pseudomonadota bacterium]